MRSLVLLRPSAIYGAAVVALALCAVNIYADSQRAAERMLALRSGPPSPAALSAFDPAHYGGAAGELVLRAQVDVAFPIQATYRRGLHQERALAFPLVAEDAQRINGVQAPVLGYFFATIPQPQSEILDFAQIMPTFEKVGDYGPLVTINGELGGTPRLTELVSSLLVDEGRAVAPTLLGVKPYPDGRAIALAQSSMSPWRTIWLVLGLALLAGGALLSFATPALEERRRVAAVVRSGRKRSGIAPEPATDKGRTRLTPLAPAPQSKGNKPKRNHSAFTAMMADKCGQLRHQVFRNQG